MTLTLLRFAVLKRNWPCRPSPSCCWPGCALGSSGPWWAGGWAVSPDLFCSPWSSTATALCHSRPADTRLSHQTNTEEDWGHKRVNMNLHNVKYTHARRGQNNTNESRNSCRVHCIVYSLNPNPHYWRWCLTLMTFSTLCSGKELSCFLQDKLSVLIWMPSLQAHTNTEHTHTIQLDIQSAGYTVILFLYMYKSMQILGLTAGLPR